MVYIAQDLGYLSEDKSIKLIEHCLKISASLGSFIKYLEKNN